MARLLNMRPDVEVEPHLEAHLLHLTKENQRPRSIRERRLTVLRVARHLGHSLTEATRDELTRWQDERVKHLSPSGMHNEIVHVSRYLRWLVTTERRLDDPTVVLVRPRKIGRRLPHPMSDAEITRALQTTEQPLHAWIALGAFCGLRCMEMATLQRESIIDAGTHSFLRVIGKGDKERVVPLPESLRAELASGPFRSSGYLFTRMDGRAGPPSAMRVSERINDYLHAIGIAATAHALRHRYGTKLYEATRDPFYVAEMMGHASTDTTRGYVQLATDKGAAWAEQVSQLGVA